MTIGWWIAITVAAGWMGSRWLRRSAELPPGDDDGTLVRLSESGNRIEAIRRYRARHGGGLKDAKEAVERLAAGGRAEPVETPTIVATPEVEALVRDGKLIGAVQAYREGHPEADLATAKTAVDAIAKRMGLGCG